MNHAVSPRFYTTRQVADRYKVSTKTVRNWVQRRILSCHIPPLGGPGGGRSIIRFSEEHLEAYDRLCERPAISSTRVTRV